MVRWFVLYVFTEITHIHMPCMHTHTALYSKFIAQNITNYNLHPEKQTLVATQKLPFAAFGTGLLFPFPKGGAYIFYFNSIGSLLSRKIVTIHT